MLTSLATKGKLDAYGPIPDRVNVESDNDILYYVYDGNNITTEHLRWTLYKRSSISERFTEVDTKLINDGDIKINLHNYGLLYENNQFLLKVWFQKNDFLVGETQFWYYYLKHTRIPKVVPYHADASYLHYQGGGGMGVAPIIKERPFPTITIKKIEDEEDKLNQINIEVNFIDMNL